MGLNIHPWPWSGIKSNPETGNCFLAWHSVRSVDTKQKEVYASPKSFLENTCNLNDIFEAESKRKIKNESLYFWREVKTIFQGRCFTVCDLVERAPKQEVIINLSFKQDLKLFVHRRGEELWLSASYVFPTEVGSTVLNVANRKNMCGAVLMVTQRNTTLLNQKNNPCIEYIDDELF